jgi:uncharacterized membrane protein
MLAIDRSADYDLIPQSVTGSATSLQQILGTAAGSLLTLVTVVLSLMLVPMAVAIRRA